MAGKKKKKKSGSIRRVQKKQTRKKASRKRRKRSRLVSRRFKKPGAPAISGKIEALLQQEIAFQKEAHDIIRKETSAQGVSERRQRSVP